MTRDLEILQAAQLCACEYGGDNLVELAFKKGAEWADAHQPSPWISVEDRLPEINQVVLTLGSEQNDEDVRLLYRSDVSGKFACIDYDEVTHWMPIPELQTLNN